MRKGLTFAALASLIVIGAGFTMWGLYSWNQYQSAPTLVSHMDLGNIDLLLSNNTNTFRVSTFEFGANGPAKAVGVYLYFQTTMPGRYYFAIILPVRLDNWTQYEGGARMTFQNANEDGSVVFGTYTQNSTAGGWVGLNMGGTSPDELVTGSRGEYTMYVPLEARYTPTPIEDVLTKSKFPVYFDGLTDWNQTEVQANIGIGVNDTLDLIYPPTAFPSTSPFHPYQGAWFLWTFQQPQLAQPIIVRYTSETEVANYQGDLFYSGLGIGIGIPTIIGAFYGSCTDREQGKPAVGKGIQNRV